MALLVRLYPRQWRDRYEAEVLELLVERPASLADRLDLVRGAIDAHLHPQQGWPMPWTHRLPGVVVAATGLLWLGAFVSAIASDESLTGTLLGLGMMTMFIALPGDYLSAYKGQIGAGIGAFVMALVVANVVDWPAAGPITLAALIGLLAGTFTIVTIRAGIDRRSRWLMLAGLVVLPAGGSLGLLVAGGALGALLVLLYPVGWTLLGIRLFVRGSATIVEPPTPGNAPASHTEVLA